MPMTHRNRHDNIHHPRHSTSQGNNYYNKHSRSHNSRHSNRLPTKIITLTSNSVICLNRRRLPLTCSRDTLRVRNWKQLGRLPLVAILKNNSKCKCRYRYLCKDKLHRMFVPSAEKKLTRNAAAVKVHSTALVIVR